MKIILNRWEARLMLEYTTANRDCEKEQAQILWAEGNFKEAKLKFRGAKAWTKFSTQLKEGLKNAPKRKPGPSAD